jgi:hypothetical protein
MQIPEPNKINNLFTKSASTTTNHVKPTIETGGVVSFDNFDIFMKGHQSPNENNAALQSKIPLSSHQVHNTKEKRLFTDGNTADLLEL